MPICAMLLAGCSPAVSGHVYFDIPTQGKAAASFGINGIPIELYLVESYAAKPGTQPLTPPVASSTDSTSTATTQTAAQTSATTAVSVGKAAEPAPPEASAPTPTPPADAAPTPATPKSPPATGTLVASIKTDGEGRFYFGGIDPGKYEVRLADDVWAQGYRLTTEKNPITVTTAFRAVAVDFGLQRDGLQPAGGNCPEAIVFPNATLCEQRYTNNNPTALQNVVIAVTYSDALAAIPRYGGVSLPSKNKVVWNFPVIKPSETVTVGFVMVPQLPATAAAKVDLTWQIENVNTQQTISLNTVSTNITSTTAAAVTIGGPTQVAPGATASFTIAVHNTGTRPLHGAVLVLVLPTNVKFEKSNHQGIFDSATQHVTWQLGDLSADAQIERVVKVTHAADLAVDTLLTYHATLASPDLDKGVEQTLSVIIH